MLIASVFIFKILFTYRLVCIILIIKLLSDCTLVCVKKGKPVSFCSWKNFIWVMVWVFHLRWLFRHLPRRLIGKDGMLSFTSRFIYKSCLASFSPRTGSVICFREIETICWHLKFLRNTTGVCKKTYKYNQLVVGWVYQETP